MFSNTIVFCVLLVSKSLSVHLNILFVFPEIELVLKMLAPGTLSF